MTCETIYDVLNLQMDHHKDALAVSSNWIKVKSSLTTQVMLAMLRVILAKRNSNHE